jgi:hypothetical protein
MATPSWALMWLEYVAAAREYVHECMGRRAGAAAPTAQRVAERMHAVAREIATRFGDGYIGDALRAALVDVTSHYLGFVATAAPDRMHALLQSATSVAAALAEYSRRRRLDPEFTRDNIDANVTRPLAASLLEEASAFSRKQYDLSYEEHERLLAHVLNIVAPYFSTLVAPASALELETTSALLRHVPE